MAALFAITMFVSAGLMFAVQPMIAKMLLPRFGGTPAVWNTCMVFFQVALLAGYGYVHVVGSRWNVRRQTSVHLALLLLAMLAGPLLALPLINRAAMPTIAAEDGSAQAYPILWLLSVLAGTVGLPFFALSATAPLLQKWFAGLRHPSARDPYFLYSASNLGSMLALIAYPLLLEPALPLDMQVWGWMGGFAVLVALMAACAVVVWRRAPEETRIEGLARLPLTVGLTMRLRWLALAFVPSSLLYGVTTHLTTDVAAVPLLWVLPLAVYLLTFIIAFARRPAISHVKLVHVFPVAILWQVFVFSLQRPIWLLFVMHLLTFLVIALACHGELARLRPSPRHLTAFYLWMTAGGALGGVFNVLLAPVLFDTLVEYPLAVVLSCFLIPMGASAATLRRPGSGDVNLADETARPTEQRGPVLDWQDLWIPLILFLIVSTAQTVLRGALESTPKEMRLPVLVTLTFGLPAAIVYVFHERPIRFGLAVAALLLVGAMTDPRQDEVVNTLVHQERTFYGTIRVVDQTKHAEPALTYRRFVHGNTLHGMQLLSDDPQVRREPLSYYFRTGPIGDLFHISGVKPGLRVAVLGLGAGALACYAEPGQTWTFYEIDPAVIRVAEARFDFLADSRQRGVRVTNITGDARLSLRDAPDHSYDLIFADAFSSDAVPVHLLTREALALYRSKLAPGGLLVFNILNRFLELEPLLAELASDAGMTARIREEVDTPISANDAADGKQAISEEDKRRGKAPSRWVVLANSEADLGTLAGKPHWRELRSQPGFRLWTDDYSNLIGVIRW